jgi:hypothetical protein
VQALYDRTGIVNLSKQRNKRALLAIRKLRRARDEQAGKIDILCNDIVSAHGDFVRQLGNLGFGVRFYESLLGESNTGGVLGTAAELIKGCVADCNVAVFLVDNGGFELHVVNEEAPIDIDSGRLESYFTSEVADSICRSNKVCSLEDMFEMGLIGNLGELGRICAAAIPLGRSGTAMGFILLYRSSQKKFGRDELEKVVGITPGLLRAIKVQEGKLPHAGGQMGGALEV